MDGNTFWSRVALASVGLMVVPAVIVFAISVNTGTPLQGAMEAVKPLGAVGLAVCLIGAYNATKC